MVTRKRQPAQSEALDPESGEIPAVIPPENEENFVPEDVAVLEMLDEYKGDPDAVVRIYRQGNNYRDLTLMHECSPAEFTPMMLAHEPFNGGTFRLHIRSRTGLYGNRMLKVMPAPVKPVNVAGSADNAILTALGETNKNILALAQAVATPREAANPLATLEGIKVIAEMFKPAAVAPVVAEDGFMKTMSAVRTFMEMSKAMSPASLPTDGEGKVDIGNLALMKGLDLFGKAMETKLTAPAKVETATIPVMVGGDTLSEAEISIPADNFTDEQRDQAVLLQLKMRQANRAASRNEDTTEWAELVFEALDDADIVELHGDAQWFEKICGMVPEAISNRAWFEKVRDAVIAQAVAEGILTAPPVASSVPEHGNPAPSNDGGESGQS